jgi:hypothetical protein
MDEQKKPAAHGVDEFAALPGARHQPAAHGRHAEMDDDAAPPGEKEPTGQGFAAGAPVPAGQ